MAEELEELTRTNELQTGSADESWELMIEISLIALCEFATERGYGVRLLY